MHEWKEANILELKRLLVFTATSEDTISASHYECASSISEPLVLSVLNPQSKDKTAQKKAPTMELREVGPSFVWRMRRNKIADPETYKLACKKPKLINVDKKNVSF